MLGLEQGEIHVGVDAGRPQEALLRTHEGERPATLRDLSCREPRLAERDDVLGERQPLHEALHPLGRGTQAAPRRVDPGQAGLRGQMGGEDGERLAVRAPRCADAPATKPESPSSVPT